MMKNILVLEDNIEINKLLTESLESEGYYVFSNFNGFEALNCFENNQIDCIVTDLMLPIMSGETFIKTVRKSSSVHIIVVSAKTTLEEKLEGLKLGADDYIIKPFSVDEVILKINNFFKKQSKTTYSLNNGMITFNSEENLLNVEGQSIELTSIEYYIIKLLFERKGRIIARKDFVDYLYQNEKSVYDRIIDTHIKNIRKKVQAIKDIDIIKTVYGLGYKLVGEFDE